MDDKEEVKKEEVKENAPLTAIQEARNAAALMKEQNDRHEALLQRQEQLAAEQALGGRTEAGQQPKKEEEVSPKAYAEKALSGEFNDNKKE